MRPVLLSLNSGQTLRLAPRETSSELKDVEVKNNPKVHKLQERRAIAVHEAEEGKIPPPAPGRKKPNPPTDIVTAQP
jgi:hypothetical protein